MKIDFPKVIAAIDLVDYAPGFVGRIDVWVNPPRKLIADIVEVAKQDGANIDDLLSQLWQGWTPDDIAQLRADAADTDPALISWLMAQTFAAIAAHRNGVKKT